MAQNIVTAVDIGSHSIKVVQLRKKGDSLSLLRLGSIELAELGRMEDSRRKLAKESALLRNLLSQVRLRTRWAMTVVSGRQVILRYTTTPPAPPAKLRQLIEFEIEEEAPGTLKEVVSDFLILDLPTRGEEYTVMIGMARNEAVNNCADILRGAGLHIQDITLAPLALYYTFLLAKGDEIEDEETCAVASIGAENIDLIVQRYGKLLFARNLTPAGRAFTEALQDEFQLPFAEAETLKQERGRIITDFAVEEGSEEERISFALAGAANNIIAAIQSSLLYFRSQTKLSELAVEKIYLTGGCVQLPGLTDYIADRIGMDVEILSPLAGLDLTGLPKAQLQQLQSNPSTYAIPLGLAHKALAEETPAMSLLPESVKRHRHFFEHTLHLLVAGGFFLSALLIGGVASARASRGLREVYTSLLEKIEVAKDQRKKLAKLRATNEALALECRALAEQLFDSRSAIEFLALLRKLTPPEVQLDTVSTFKGSIPSPRPTGSRGRSETKKQEKIFYIEGFVRATMPEPEGTRHIEASEAIDIVRSFAQKLEVAVDTSGRSLFSRSEIPLLPSEPGGKFRLILTLRNPANEIYSAK